MLKTIWHKNSECNRNTGGFTLIEVAIVIMLAGFMLIPLTTVYKNYKLQKERAITDESVSYTSSIIAQYPSANGRYPCPSDRSLVPGDALYGQEQYAGIPDCEITITVDPDTGLTINTVVPHGICRAVGPRDTDDAGTENDPVIIGGIPIATLLGSGNKVGSTYVLDGWGNQLTYAVSDRLCDPSKTSTKGDYRRGVIAAVDEFDQPTAGIGMADMDIPPDGTEDANGHFVVLSHGPTGVGGFTTQGAQIAPCNVDTLDGENCDNDFTFRSALGKSDAEGVNFYDDMIYFHLYQSSELWANIPTVTGASTPHIWNRNALNVGILTDTPQERLDVNGTLNAATVRADVYCKKSVTAATGPFNYNTDCMHITLLGAQKTSGANKNTCAAGEVVLKIWGGKVVCGKPSIAAPAAPQKCQIGTYLQGIKSNGDIICTPP